ncbi:MAG: FG-GAP-like repeat-containing protein, partial [Candidatus Peregrinibacteria bacterium]
MALIPKKLLCGLVAFTILFVEVGMSATAYAATVNPTEPPNDPEIVYDLVAIVVDTSIDKDGSSYVGLNDEFLNILGETTIGERVVRYAEDIRNDNELTDVRILLFDKEKETVDGLASALENLYVNGDGTHENRLVGAVFVGDIPLPVVNENGNRFVSMLPYVDFYEKTYLYNSETKTFEKNPTSNFSMPEIWHGVIRADKSGVDGKEQLAEYFDKNHLYYAGEPMYANFSDRMFFGDLVHEEKMMNSDSYQAYLKYLNAWEDLAYLRYNKYWADAESGTVVEDLKADGFEIADDAFAQQLADIDLTNNLPDIYSKQIIDQFLIPYYKVFPNYISQANDFAAWTGRYAAGDEGEKTDNVPVLITTKDEYTKYYLKIVNDALEKKINEVVDKIQEPLPVLETSNLSGKFVSGNTTRNFQIAGNLPGAYAGSVSLQYNYEQGGELYINGTNTNVLTSAKQCGFYLGSKSLGEGYSTLTKSMRSDDPGTAFAVPAAGVNTRLLSPTEANILSGYKVSNGARIENNSEWGVEAFIENPLTENHQNPWESVLRAGDIITKVNGKDISAEYTFDQAIEDSYNAVKNVIESINKDNLEFLDYSMYDIAIRAGESFSQRDINKTVGNIGIEYYRGGQKATKNFTFTVGVSNGNYFASKEDTQGNPEIIVLLSGIGYPSDIGSFSVEFFDKNSDGAIFNLYDTDYQNYDSSAGCNKNSAGNGDVCSYATATIPVLDPAGSTDDFQFTGGNVDEVMYNSCYANVRDTDQPDAGNVVLNNVEDAGGHMQVVTLKHFSDRWGLFDGVDNDDDGIRDYEWRDEDGDGVYETKFFDFDEAEPKYGIPSSDLGAITRKMLSHNSSYTIPAGLTNSPFDSDVTLNVSAGKFQDKNISSAILHNEPTAYTITEQIKSAGTDSLPIDNPRYIYFQTKPANLPAYPEPQPANENIDVEEIVSGLKLDPYYFPGKSEKIIYPNLFETSNFAQLEADLATLANNLAVMPGGYRLFGQNATSANYSALEIRNEILNKYLLPVVNGISDYPNDLELEGGETLKIYDALEWRNLNIDQKHEYVLEKYLSGAENAFVGDETLLPAQSGHEVKNGYEAAYLVLDSGSEGYETGGFDMSFNKDIPEEKNEVFDPLYASQQAAIAEEAAAEAETGETGGGGGGGDSFVDLDQFLKELMDFIGYFSTTPGFDSTCSSGGQTGSSGGGGGNGEGGIKLTSYTFFVTEATDELESTSISETSDEVTADGESLMMVEAAIVDDNGILDDGASQTVTFKIESDVPDIVTFESDPVVKPENGVATVYLKAGTKAGKFTLFANDDSTELYAAAGEAASVAIESDSYVLAVGGESKTRVHFTLKDKFENPANNSFSQIALFVGDKAKFDDAVDEDSQLPGTQIKTFEGKADVDLYSKNDTGDVNVIAVVMDYDLEEKLIDSGKNWGDINFEEYAHGIRKFSILDNVQLKLTPDKTSIPADGISVVSIKTDLLHDGQIVEDYSGPVKFTVLNYNLGKFLSAPPEKMTNGALHEANVKFRSSTVAGDAEILVEVPGFASETVKFKTLPRAPVKITLSADSDYVYSDSDKDVVLTARLEDKYGNLADNDNSTVVSFAATDSTAGFVEFSGAHNAVAFKGVASTTVKGGEISGDANIIASSQGVASGTLSLKVKKHITYDLSPRALYVSLLGNNNMAQSVLFSGQVEAVSAVTATPDKYKRLVDVDGYGRVNLLSDTISAKVISATDSFPYQKIIFSDDIAGEEIASVFFVPKTDSDLVLLDDNNPAGSDEGIYVERISKTDGNIQFTKKDDGMYIEKSGEVKVKIDNFGRISMNDPLLELSIPTSEDDPSSDSFSLLIYDRGEVLAQVSYRQNFVTLNGEKQDVIKLGYDSAQTAFYPGIYLKMNSASDRYETHAGFSGASTAEPMGLYVTDTESELSVKDEFGAGFKGTDKHMLLYAAGNSVGESNMPYSPETSIVYGDPMIRLKVDGVVGLVSELSGFTKDLGRALFSGKEEIIDMTNFDYNGDGISDLLLFYENGGIRLMENEVSNKRFKDRGIILNVYDGIFSATKIDVNNDGYDDLVVGTKEACLNGEVAASLFTNTGGKFKRSTLNLTVSGKIFEMKSHDMNLDGCEDLVLSDSSGNVRVFYNGNDGHACTGIETNYGNSFNFGFSINEDVDSSNNLYVNYSGMEQMDEGTAEKNYEDSNADKFVSFVLQTNQAPAANSENAAAASAAQEMQSALLANENIASKEIPQQTYPKQFDFIHLKEDPKFGINSTKYGVDVNGGNVDVGDKINYVVTLSNSGSGVSNMMISDLTPVTMSLDTDSLQCLDNNCPDDPVFEETEMSVRSHVIKNISIPASGKRTIKYTMTVESVPEVHFDVGNFIDDESGKNYPDILVRPEFNPDGVLTYLYSKGLDAKGYSVLDKKQVASEGSSALDSAYEQQSEDAGLGSVSTLLESKDMLENLTTENASDFQMPPDLAKQTNDLVTQQSQDRDYDGCPDSWGGKKDMTYSSVAGAIAAEV